MGAWFFFTSAAHAESYLPDGYVDMIQLEGDLSQPLPGTVLTQEMIQQFLDPAQYQILDAQDTDANSLYCHKFYDTSVAVTYPPLRPADKGQFQDVSITIQGLSTDWCDETGIQPGESAVPRPYSITLQRKNGQLFVTGAETNHVTIIRRPIERIGNGNGTWHDYTKVKTTGTVKKQGNWFVYTTPWKPIFNDLRGVGYILGTKQTKQAAFFQYYGYGLRHNKTLSGKYYNSVSYETCLKQADFYQLCFGKKGNNLIVAMKTELMPTMTLWIDSKFVR